MKIVRLEVEGFRSLKKATWTPGDLNVVIGPNGSGKSNLLRLLELLSVCARGGLAKYIQSQGGLQAILWDGQTDALRITADLAPFAGSAGRIRYDLSLSEGRLPGQLQIAREVAAGTPSAATRAESRAKRTGRVAEKLVARRRGKLLQVSRTDGDDSTETSLATMPTQWARHGFVKRLRESLRQVEYYVGMPTHASSPVRRCCFVSYEKRLEPDGANLVAVLHTLYTENRDFKESVDSAMRVAFCDEFQELVFQPSDAQRIHLGVRWKTLRRPTGAYDLSDGTLRFLFLITALASPELPSVIAIDDPETALHPTMLPIVAEYAEIASRRAQVIFTTHSAQFLDAFYGTKPTVTIADWRGGETSLRMPDEETLKYWLEDYSLGSLFSSGQLEQME